MKCPICETRDQVNYFGSKLVCMRCDQLTFDVEIECDEIKPKPTVLKSRERTKSPAEAATN